MDKNPSINKRKKLSELSKEEIHELLLANELIIVDNDNPKATSDVWKYFGFPCRIISSKANNDNKKNKEIEVNKNFTACKYCKSVLVYDSKATGNNSLVYHSTICKFLPKNPSVIGYFKRNRNEYETENLKAQLVESVGNFFTLDIRPFSTVEGKGFKKLVQKLITIGAQYGNIEINEILPTRTPIKCFVSVASNRIFKEMQNLMAKAIFFQKVALSTDMWTDVYNKHSYINLMA